MVSWADVRRRLEVEVGELGDDEFVVLGEPQPEPGPRTGLLRRRTQPPPTRYVQFRGDGEVLHAECVGATLFGGDWEVDEAQHARLRTRGWRAPGEEDPEGVAPSYPNYWAVLPREQAADLAGMGVDALTELGADPAALEWRRER